jgi:hypothetical protein
MPLMTESVQRYISTKKMPNHQVDALMIKKPPDFDKSPPRKTLVNIPSHIHVHVITATKVAKPRGSSAGFDARILLENSSIPIALVSE